MRLRGQIQHLDNPPEHRELWHTTSSDLQLLFCNRALTSSLALYITLSVSTRMHKSAVKYDRQAECSPEKDCL